MCGTQWIVFKIRKKSINNKNIVIVFQQIFGDAVIFSDVVERYLKLYKKEQGYKVYLLVRPSVGFFLKEVIALPEDVELRIVDFSRFVREFTYYKSIIEEYKELANTIIVPGTSLSAEIFAASCRGNKVSGAMNTRYYNRRNF